MPVYPGAPTSRPAPVPRLGTLPLAVHAARGPPSRSQQGTLAQLTWPSLSGRQVLLFRASARDELTPPLHRAPPGQHAGRPLAEGTQHARAFVPGTMRLPGFDAIVPPIDASAVVHTRSSSRRTPNGHMAGHRLRRRGAGALRADCGALPSQVHVLSDPGTGYLDQDGRDLAGAAGAGNPFRTPGHDPSGQIRVPATAGRSRNQSVRDTPGRNPRQPLQVPVWVVVA